MTGIFILACRLIFSVHLHALYWRIPPRSPPARAPEEPVVPFLSTPTSEWPHRRAISRTPLRPRLRLPDLLLCQGARQIVRAFAQVHVDRADRRCGTLQAPESRLGLAGSSPRHHFPSLPFRALVQPQIHRKTVRQPVCRPGPAGVWLPLAHLRNRC